MAGSELSGKIRTIKDELESNPRIVIGSPLEWELGESSSLAPPDKVSSLGLDIFIYPEQSTYDPEELNDLLSGLVDVEPTRLDYFSLYFEGGDRPTDRRLVLGRLCFDELVVNPLVADIALRRSISLHLFPDAGHLLDALDGRNLYDIPVGELGQGTFSQLDASAFAVDS